MIRTSFVAGLAGVSMALGAMQSLEARADEAAACGTLCDPARDLAAGQISQGLAYEAPEAPVSTTVKTVSPVDPMTAPALATRPLEELAQGADPASTAEFVRQAAMSQTLETRASLVARQWATDPQVRMLATNALERSREDVAALSTLARNAGVEVALAAFDAPHAAQLTKMRMGEAGSLDQAYVDLLADSRTKAAAFYEIYAREGEDPALRAFAQRRLAALRAQITWLNQLTMG